MQSCTIHHCVLFFCTLTFTSVPTLAFTPVTVKLHQSVKLPCNYTCPGQGRWTMLHDEDNVLAECDQTSCRTRDGYNMFYDEYQQGELSLTISTADYSKRGLYTCDCDGIDIRDVRLSIETLKSSVELNPGEVLLMDLPVPQPVAVIYKARDSPALYGEQICTVTHQLLQCKTKYTPRTSLTYTTLTLRDVNITDSGIYTIRDLKNEEDIHIYTLFITEMQRIDGEKSVNVLSWILPVLILVMVVIITGIVCFIKIRSKRVKKQQMEQQEQERLLHEQERQRLIQQLEQERLQQLEHERFQQLEHERLQQLEQERLQQLEQERLQQLEQERLQQLEQERLQQQKEKSELQKELSKSLKCFAFVKQYVEKQLHEKEAEYKEQCRAYSEAHLDTFVHIGDMEMFPERYSVPFGEQTQLLVSEKKRERTLPRRSHSDTYKSIHDWRKFKKFIEELNTKAANTNESVLELDESQQEVAKNPDDPDVLEEQAEEQISLLQQENAGTLNHQNRTAQSQKHVTMTEKPPSVQ